MILLLIIFDDCVIIYWNKRMCLEEELWMGYIFRSKKNCKNESCFYKYIFIGRVYIDWWGWGWGEVVLWWLGLIIYFFVLFYFDGGGLGLMLLLRGFDINLCWKEMFLFNCFVKFVGLCDLMNFLMLGFLVRIWFFLEFFNCVW